MTDYDRAWAAARYIAARHGFNTDDVVLAILDGYYTGYEERINKKESV